MIADNLSQSIDDYQDVLLPFIGSTKDVMNEDLIDWFELTKTDKLNFNEFKDLFSAFFFGDISAFENDIINCFKWFDKDVDGVLNRDEFTSLCSKIFQPFLQSKSAFVIVDVQNDFISGSLALKNCPAKEDGEEVVPVINAILKKHIDNEYRFNLIVYTYDWHPSDHISFYENIHCRRISHLSAITHKDVKLLDKVTIETDSGEVTDQILWPKHCVQNTEGAALHKDLLILESAFHLRKGVSPNVDSYSAFGLNHPKAITDLNNELKQNNVDILLVCGLASDVCVAQTASDALTLGYKVAIVEDASRGVDKTRIRETKLMLIERQAIIISSKMIPYIIKGKLRPVEFVIFKIRSITGEKNI